MPKCLLHLTMALRISPNYYILSFLSSLPKNKTKGSSMKKHSSKKDLFKKNQGNIWL